MEVFARRAHGTARICRLDSSIHLIYVDAQPDPRDVLSHGLYSPIAQLSIVYIVLQCYVSLDFRTTYTLQIRRSPSHAPSEKIPFPPFIGKLFPLAFAVPCRAVPLRSSRNKGEV